MVTKWAYLASSYERFFINTQRVKFRLHSVTLREYLLALTPDMIAEIQQKRIFSQFDFLINVLHLHD